MIALLRNLQPNVKGIELISTNLLGTKQVVIAVNGDHYTLSPRLSESFRNKIVSADELGNYVVRDVVGADKTEFKSLGYAGEDLTITFGAWKGVAPSTKVVKVEEISTLSWEQVAY